MGISSLGIISIALYVAAACRVARPGPGVREGRFNAKWQATAIASAALIVHALVLYPNTVIGGGFNLGIFNAGSLVTWCIAAVVLAFGVGRPIESLTVVILPITAIALALSLLFPSTRLLGAEAPLGLQVHIALSILAYSLFAIAAVQAGYLFFAEQRLRNHAPILGFLPPLPIMEKFLFQLTTVAFALLTASLLLGGLYIENVGAQHLSHKIVFSIIAWLIFATLIWGRWRWGWRGRRAIKFVISGFVLLAVAFFGTKIVLELILHRV